MQEGNVIPQSINPINEFENNRGLHGGALPTALQYSYETELWTMEEL